jgi:transposase, IS30 family
MTYRQLSTEERYQIAALRQQGFTVPQIAAALRRHSSTIGREVKRNATPYDGAYRPNMAVEMTNGRRSRSRRNARYGGDDFAPIEALLEQRWSPAEIVGRRRREGLPVMSHETIYLWIWRDKEAGGSLWTHLRGARKRRRKRYGRNDSRGRLAGKRPIQERPKIVARRGRIGDWEGDTVHGRGKPCIVTIVERKTGFVCIGPLPRATVEHTNASLVELLSNQPHKVHTLTSDNGVEFHGYKDLERQLHLKVYFATPHHAWERGTNENTNGLIRQYLPKGTPLGHLTQACCNEIADALNHRPRRRLGFRTPHEVYYDSVRRTRR